MDSNTPPAAHDIREDSAFQRLSMRHQRFVLEYVIDLNATKAYIKIFPDSGATAAGVNGHKLLKNTKIFLALKEVQGNVLNYLGITAARVLREVGRCGFLDIRQTFNEAGTLLSVHEMPEDVAAAISSIEVFEQFEGAVKDRVFIGYTKKVKFVDKRGSLELLMRHASPLNDKLKVQHDATDPLKQLLTELGSSAFQPVALDPDYANTAPGAVSVKKKQWQAPK